MDLNAELDDFAGDNNLTVNQVLGFLLYQRNYQDNKKFAALGKELYETKNIEDSKRSLDLDKILGLKNHLDMSVNHMNFCKRFLSPYHSIPNEKYIRAYSNTILPETCVWKTAPDYEPTSVFISSREDVVCLTVKRLVEMLQK
ncbi:unnamed protein product [Didymodactylos carnosus]|uniref:Uncharacterized protein n=1 Tax=Didymodactylos carnosus TaxID=1234261 RepID=A0A814YYM3_9BILA|nr:unnamed protein product [Didymodactylos carnosus]CAF1234714.1 unnamed protein product [Didymodactylos carnosus]CAF3682796.1 unnamed protein product [Didymodactylos carnosus]CAF3997236.1 unnamed protein product [Didymodactylos carnosus]